MKKLRLFLALLCAVAGLGAWAQTAPEVSTAENPKWYKIRSYNRGGFLTDPGSGSTLQHVTMTSDSYWRFEDAGTNDGAMHMISKKGNAVSGKWKTGTTAMKVWVLSNGQNQYGMSISAQNNVSANCIDASNHLNTVDSWAPTSTDWQGTTWVFIEANPYATIVSIGEAATSIEEGKWYLLYNKGRNGYPSIEHAANSHPNPKMRAKSSMAVGTIAHNYGHMLYKFTKHGDNYYVATGDQLYFSLGNNSAAVEFAPRAYSIKNITNQTDIFWLQDSVSTYVANGQEIGNGFVGWQTVEPGASSNGAYQFLPVVICSQDVEYILNGTTIKTERNVTTLPTEGGTVIIDNKNYKILTVTQSEEIVNEKRTATATVEQIEDDVQALKAELKAFINEMPTYATGGVGYYTEASVADVNNAKDAALKVIADENATAVDVRNAKTAIETAQAALTIELPSAGKYYYIQSAYGNFYTEQRVYKGMYQTGGSNKWKTLDKADLNFVWQWTPKDNDGWAVKNIGGDNYLNTVSDLSATEPSGNITLLWLELGQFNIKATGGAKMHCESHGGGSGVSGNIVGWDAGANTASAWSIIELTTEDVKALAQAQIAEFNTLQAGTEIGYFAQDTYNTAKAAKEALEANETMDNVIDLRNAIKAAKQNVNSPKPGHFYAIRDHRYNTYVDGSLTAPSTVTGMVGKMAHTAKENDKLKAGHIWYFDNDMKGYSFDAGFGVKNATEKAGATDAKVFTFELKDDKTECPKTFAVRVPNGENNVNTYWYIHNTGTEKYGYVDRNGTTYAANNCQFYIEEVKELTLNVTSAKAATLCLPVACRVPADLKVYTATGTVVEKENRLQLQLIQKEGDNTTLLPANTPVFVWGPAGAYTLDLDVTAASIDGTNIFSGTTAAIAHDTSDNAMVLGRESTTDDLGFFRTTSTSINGFRAYLESSTVDTLFPATASARGIKVTFTDITTAIEAAESNISEGATCDINGRQVRNIGKGLYIVNGKKIMVK